VYTVTTPPFPAFLVSSFRRSKTTGMLEPVTLPHARVPMRRSPSQQHTFDLKVANVPRSVRFLAKGFGATSRGGRGALDVVTCCY
jgi:hypothetical protein